MTTVISSNEKSTHIVLDTADYLALASQVNGVALDLGMETPFKLGDDGRVLPNNRCLRNLLQRVEDVAREIGAVQATVSPFQGTLFG